MSKINIQIQKILHLLIYIYLNKFLDDFSLDINSLIPLIIACHVHLFAQALEFRTPFFSHLVPPAIMVWILVWKYMYRYIFEPFIHILQHFMLQLSRSVKTAAGPRNKS